MASSNRSRLELLGILLAFLSGLLPVITFGWRLVIAVVVLGATTDLCWFSELARRFRPTIRVWFSIVAVTTVGAFASQQLRKEYLIEHPPPSFVYMVPRPVFNPPQEYIVPKALWPRSCISHSRRIHR